MKFSCVLMLGLLTVGQASACDEDMISTVSSEGAVIVMLSGAVYRVDIGDRLDSALWLPPADVLVCDDRIINKDESGESVGVVRIR
jgi:hypothetical protein